MILPSEEAGAAAAATGVAEVRGMLLPLLPRTWAEVGIAPVEGPMETARLLPAAIPRTPLAAPPRLLLGKAMPIGTAMTEQLRGEVAAAVGTSGGEEKAPGTIGGSPLGTA